MFLFYGAISTSPDCHRFIRKPFLQRVLVTSYSFTCATDEGARTVPCKHFSMSPTWALRYFYGATPHVGVVFLKIPKYFLITQPRGKPQRLIITANVASAQAVQEEIDRQTVAPRSFCASVTPSTGCVPGAHPHKTSRLHPPLPAISLGRLATLRWVAAGWERP